MWIILYENNQYYGYKCTYKRTEQFIIRSIHKTFQEGKNILLELKNSYYYLVYMQDNVNFFSLFDEDGTGVIENIVYFRYINNELVCYEGMKLYKEYNELHNTYDTDVKPIITYNYCITSDILDY